MNQKQEDAALLVGLCIVIAFLVVVVHSCL